MSDLDAMAERHNALLQELAGLGMTVARELGQRVAAAETVEAAEGLALAFHRVSRSVRQTLALEAKLARDLRAIARDDHAQSEALTRRRVQQRQARVRAALARDLWTEYEEDEAERLNEILFERLEEAALDDAFLQGPVEACIARLRADLGLPANDSSPPSRDPARCAAAVADP